MIRVLVIGVGSIGERHARCFQQTGRAQVSVCEINEELRAAAASRYALEHAFADWEEALQSRFDAAVICTPAHLHVSMAMQLLARKKHVLIEKPLSIAMTGVDELRQAAATAGVAVMMAYVVRMHPAVQGMKQAIDSVRFGKPLHVIGCSGQHFPTYRPAYRDIYYKDRATGGGAIQDALTHMINMAEWLVGPIHRVAADCAHQILEGVEVEDTVNVIARHGDLLGAYALNQYQAPNELTLTVVCQRGTMRFQSHHSRWQWCVEPGGPWLNEPAGKLERDDLFVEQAHRFLDVVGGNAEPSCSLADGIQTLRANLAILRAADTGAWVDVQE